MIKRKKTRSLVLNLSSSGASLTFRWRSQCAIGKRSLEPGKEWEVGTTRTGLMAEQERTCWSRERCTGKPDSWATETFKDCYWDETASCWRNGQWDVREKVENIFSKIGGKLFSKGTLQQGMEVNCLIHFQSSSPFHSYNPEANSKQSSRISLQNSDLVAHGESLVH